MGATHGVFPLLPCSMHPSPQRSPAAAWLRRAFNAHSRHTAAPIVTQTPFLTNEINENNQLHDRESLIAPRQKKVKKSSGPASTFPARRFL